MIKNKAQVTLEVSILIAIIAAALIASTVYIKRAIQGRLRSAADDIGSQYSPTNTTSNYVAQSNSSETSDTQIENSGTLNARSVTTSDQQEDTSRISSERIQDYSHEPMF